MTIEDQLEQFSLTCGLDAARWDHAAPAYRRYWQLVQAHNAENALMATGITEADFYLKHLADSLAVLQAYPELRTTPQKTADVGAGGGLPGIPLAIALPQLHLTLIESIGKKARFLELAVKELGLTGRAEVVARRSREIQGQPPYRGRFDLVVARAVSSADKMIADCRRLLAPAGRLILYKTPESVAEELPLARREAAKHGLSVATSPILDLPANAGKRQFISIGK